MVNSIFSCLAILFVYAAAIDASAQEAPPRFTKFEFPSGKKTLYPYGDTIILVGKEDFEVTTNEGKTWEIIPRDSSIKITAHPNHPVLYYTDIRQADSIWSFYISKDLGRTFERRSIGKDTVGYWRSLGGAWGGAGIGGPQFSPWDPDMLYVTAYIPGIVSFMELIRSRDGGRTWFYQDTPRPTDGSAGLEYEISFNRRNPARWHIRIKATYHAFDEDYYYTDDDGDSFTRVSNWSVYLGIRDEDDVLTWDRPGAYQTRYRGPSVSNIFSDKNGGGWTELDWFSNAGLKNYERSDTLIYGFDPVSYLPWYLDPSISVIRVDSTLYPKFKVKSKQLFLMRESGEVFELLWRDTGASLGAMIDPKQARVWAFHTSWEGDATVWYTSFTKSDVKRGKTGVQHFQLYPNPASDKATFSLPSTAPGYWCLTDALGRVVRTQEFDSSISAITLNLRDVPSGAYHLIVHSDGIVHQLPLHVVR